jgi:hypothetical protein
MGMKNTTTSLPHPMTQKNLPFITKHVANCGQQDREFGR